MLDGGGGRARRRRRGRAPGGGRGDREGGAARAPFGAGVEAVLDGVLAVPEHRLELGGYGGPRVPLRGLRRLAGQVRREARGAVDTRRCAPVKSSRGPRLGLLR